MADIVDRLRNGRTMIPSHEAADLIETLREQNKQLTIDIEVARARNVDLCDSLDTLREIIEVWQGHKHGALERCDFRDDLIKAEELTYYNQTPG